MGIRLGRVAWRWAALVVGVGVPCVLVGVMREVASWRPRVLFESKRPVSDVVFSPTEPILACVSWSTTVQIWDSQKRTLLWQQKAGLGTERIVFSADGRLLASEDDRHGITIFDAHTGKCFKTLYDKRMGDFEWFQFAPDGKAVISSGDDRQMWSCDLASGRCHCLLSPPGDYESSRMMALKTITAAGLFRRLKGLILSPDAKTIVGTLQIIEHPKGEPPHASRVSDEQYWFCDAKGHPQTRLASTTQIIGFSPDSRWLLTYGYTTTSTELKFWDTRTKKLGRPLERSPLVEMGNVTNMGFAHNGNWIFQSVDTANSSLAQVDHIYFIIWDVNTGRIMRTIEFVPGTASRGGLSLSADDSVVAVADDLASSLDYGVRLWRVQ